MDEYFLIIEHIGTFLCALRVVCIQATRLRSRCICLVFAFKMFDSIWRLLHVMQIRNSINLLGMFF